MATEGVFDLIAAGEGLVDLHRGAPGIGKHPGVQAEQVVSSDQAGARREVPL